MEANKHVSLSNSVTHWCVFNSFWTTVDSVCSQDPFFLTETLIQSALIILKSEILAGFEAENGSFTLKISGRAAAGKASFVITTHVYPTLFTLKWNAVEYSLHIGHWLAASSTQQAQPAVGNWPLNQTRAPADWS